jgi:DNA-binding HxlR family transcriptional regulator
VSSHLKLIGDRWTLFLLLELDDVRGMRFDALAAAEGLSRRVLTERLRMLEGNGLVLRRRYNARPPRFDYLLTERGMRAQRAVVELRAAVMGVADRAAIEAAPQPPGAAVVHDHPADALLAGDPARAREIFESTVAVLVRYDRQYDTAMLETLETYLDADASTAVAAARLYAHRHTIRYRLGRVQELTGLDVELQADRERLTLGLRAWRMYGNRWRDEGR